MSLSDDAAFPPDPAPLPPRTRDRRPAAPDAADAVDEEPFQGCPLFPLSGASSRGRSYAEVFARAKLTEASVPELGLRIRLVSPNADEDGTTRPTFGIPLLPLDTTVEAIQDRWGPGCYEIGLCRRTVNDRTKAELISRRVRIVPRTGGDWGERGEFDVGREAWPLDLSTEDGQVTDAMREEILYRSEVRAERASRGEPGVARRGEPFEYGRRPYDLDDVPSVRVAPEPPRPSALDSLVGQFAADPVGTATKVAAGLAAFREVFGQLAPKSPSAQEIAAATSAAVAQALAPLAQALATRPAGSDPAEVIRLQMEAARADSARQLAELRGAMEAQRLASEQQFKLALAQQQHEARARDLMHQLDAAKSAGETEKRSILAELAEVRKRLQAGESDASPGLLDQLAGVLDTRFGEALAPLVAPHAGRLLDVIAGAPSGAPAAPSLESPPPQHSPAPAPPEDA